MSNDQDRDVNIEPKNSKARPTANAWAIGIAAIISAVGAASLVWSQFFFAVLALVLQYEEVNFRDSSASRYSRPPIERQHSKKEERQVAEPETRPDDKTRGRPLPNGRGVAEGKRKVGEPLDLRPKIVDGGTVERIEPVQQGDPDEDSPEDLPRGAFEQNGRWYEKRPFECKTLGGLPMPYEACSVSPDSPGGRPIVRQ